MQNQLINPENVQFILDESFDVNFWYYQLGICTVDQIAMIDKRISSDYFEIGKQYWIKIDKILTSILCDESKKAPKEIYSNLLSGDKYTIVQSLASIIFHDARIVNEVLVPIVAILIRIGLDMYCSREN